MSRRYAVKEIYFTLQGEGFHTGRPAIFLRFAGCNLWSGREPDRAAATCQFCDTDFLGTDGPGGGTFDGPDPLAEAVERHWLGSVGGEDPGRSVVCTGGEPLLQLDSPLVEALHRRGFRIAVETNGTIVPPPGIDWLTVSPKAGTELVATAGDELKLIYPQTGAAPERYRDLRFRHFFLQPMDGPDLARNTSGALAYCRAHPEWRLSLQSHKLLGIP